MWEDILTISVLLCATFVTLFIAPLLQISSVKKWAEELYIRGFAEKQPVFPDLLTNLEGAEKGKQLPLQLFRGLYVEPEGVTVKGNGYILHGIYNVVHPGYQEVESFAHSKTVTTYPENANLVVDSIGAIYVRLRVPGTETMLFLARALVDKRLYLQEAQPV